MKVPAGKHLLDLVAVDWFKDTKRMDHVARRQGCAAQVSTSPANPSLVLCCSSQTSKLTLVSLFFLFALWLSCQEPCVLLPCTAPICAAKY